MKYFLAILASMFLTGCTWSFTNIDTHGTADDLVNEDQTPNIQPSLTVPVSSI